MLSAIAISSPWAVVAGLVPLLIVLPVLSWLDRVEPEPRSSKVHALLWGACVAVVVASVANAIVAALFGEIGGDRRICAAGGGGRQGTRHRMGRATP